MLTIVQGQANTIVVTLTERVTLDDPKYLFVFRNPLTKDYTSCIAADTSSYTARYNQFSITETDTPTRTAGQVDLDLTGVWEYEIYEQSSTSNLDPDNATTLLETGFCNVKPATPASNTAYEPDDTTNVVYNG